MWRVARNAFCLLICKADSSPQLSHTRCDFFVPPHSLCHLCLFSGLQRSAEAESGAEAEYEAEFSLQ